MSVSLAISPKNQSISFPPTDQARHPTSPDPDVCLAFRGTCETNRRRHATFPSRLVRTHGNRGRVERPLEVGRSTSLAVYRLHGVCIALVRINQEPSARRIRTTRIAEPLIANIKTQRSAETVRGGERRKTIGLRAKLSPERSDYIISG